MCGQMTGVARTMAGLIADALRRATPDSITRHFARPTTFLRLPHYPTQREEEGLFGASAAIRTTASSLLLAQDDVGGLEVRNKAGVWCRCLPFPIPSLMNVGDILARWSNDRFVSTPHRVINRSGRERYSQSFFFDPAMQAAPLPSFPACVPAGENAKYPPVIYGDYLMERIDKNYRSHGAQGPA